MNQDTTDVTGHFVPLAEMIETVRTELQAAHNQSDPKDLQFKVKTVELELKVMTEKGKGGGLNILAVSGKLAKKDQLTHTFKLTLEPLSSDEAKDKAEKIGELLVSSDEMKKPL